MMKSDSPRKVGHFFGLCSCSLDYADYYCHQIEVNNSLKCSSFNRPRDYYHTCYCLSGLSVAQNFIGDEVGNLKVLGPKKNHLVRKYVCFIYQ